MRCHGLWIGLGRNYKGFFLFFSEDYRDGMGKERVLWIGANFSKDGGTGGFLIALLA